MRRSERQSELNELTQVIGETLDRIKQDVETKLVSKRCSKDLDKIKRYIDYKEKETQRMINSVKKFARAVGAVEHTPQFTQFTQFSDEIFYDEDSEPSKEHSETGGDAET